ncbi:MAG: VWA domain-containing protein [Chloroflexi bacterium]|nr:VWA domain-containing protein [Chloroflexota bacterium]
MGEFKYSEWDGSQNLFDMDADELMDKVGNDLMSNENLADIMRRMMRNGMRNRQGQRLPGLQEMLERLRQKRQQQLDKYDLGSVVDEIREKLNEIKKKERGGIQEQLDKAREKAGQKPGQDNQNRMDKAGQKAGQQAGESGQEGQEGAGEMTPEMRERLNQLRQQAGQNGKGQRGKSGQPQSGQQGSPQGGQQGDGGLNEEQMKKLLESLEERARQNTEKLDGLPKDLGGQIKELTDYDFMDAEARQEFQELLDMLKKHAMESMGRDMMQKLQSMDPQALANMRNMIEALNQMLEQRMRGEEPDFNQFMEQFGDFFGDNPPQNLDELIERLQNQIAQAQNLMNSLSAKDRQALQDMLDSMLDEATKMEMAKLARNLDTLFPLDDLLKEYSFEGEESLSYTEALKLMEELQKMDRLEQQMREAQRDSMDSIDPELFKELMGDESAEELERLRELMKKLEEAGYIRWKNGKYELTPQGMRKIGQKALQDIFSQLRKDRIAGHSIKAKGRGGEKEEETKKFEFGDDFDIDFQKTLMNALRRGETKPPMKLTLDDFEITQWHSATRTAIVLMLDMSLSMFMRNYFEAAKRTAIALDCLIRSQFPKDVLHIVGFSQYARVIKKEDLFYVGQNRYEHGTNLQHALMLAEKLLAKEGATNKQIILISDGEPTAHIENGDIYFQYPPTLRTMQMTLREVRNVTQKGITINMFMLDDSLFLSSFVNRMASLNKGRVFFADPSDLGKYVLHDYITKKKKLIS